MSGEVLLEIAVKYRLEDVRGAVTPGGQLANILAQLETGVTLSNTLLKYLDGKGFLALMCLGAKKITYADYIPFAAREQVERISAASDAEREQEARITAKAEAERRERERVESEWRAIEQKREAEQRARMNDPRYQAKIREAELKEKYGLNEYVDPADYPKLMGLVRMLDRGNRVGPKDVAWLSTRGWDKVNSYLTAELESRYHEIEANFLVSEFKRTGDPWQAVNASSHFRKCGKPGQAEKLLGAIDVSRIREAKLKSALCTTRGGVKRDLGDLAAAFDLGSQAHALTPDNFMPCTLLGAVCYERGDCEQGREWYDKAVKRGFKEADRDRELRSIFWRLDPEMQAEMRAHLLSMDPERYKWAVSNVKPIRRPATGVAP